MIKIGSDGERVNRISLFGMRVPIKLPARLISQACIRKVAGDQRRALELLVEQRNTSYALTEASAAGVRANGTTHAD